MGLDFRRGAAEIAKAQEKSSGGGTFRPFAPKFFWKDGDSKYLFFLNNIEEIPTVDLIGFIPVPGKSYFEEVIARTDRALGESHDRMVDKWDAQPKEACIAVAVELEPVLEEVKGRMKPTRFEVKMRTFDRRVRDEDGELTDDYEEVEAPEIGIITQSPKNFFNVVRSFDAEESPIDLTPVKVTRVGDDSGTVYTITGYDQVEVDLSGLLDCVENISYLSTEERTELIEIIDEASDEDAATAIGGSVLNKRLDELVDLDRYNEIFDTISESLDKYGKKKGAKKSAAKSKPTRRSQRRTAESVPAEEPTESAEETQTSEPAPRPKPSEDKLEKLADLKAKRERASKRSSASAS